MKKAGITWDQNTMGKLFGSLIGAGQSYYDSDDLYDELYKKLFRNFGKRDF